MTGFSCRDPVVGLDALEKSIILPCDQVEPAMVDQAGNVGVAMEDGVDSTHRRFDDDQKSQGRVLGFFAVVNGFPGQAGFKISAVAR